MSNGNPDSVPEPTRDAPATQASYVWTYGKKDMRRIALADFFAAERHSSRLRNSTYLLVAFAVAALLAGVAMLVFAFSSLLGFAIAGLAAAGWTFFVLVPRLAFSMTGEYAKELLGRTEFFWFESDGVRIGWKGDEDTYLMPYSRMRGIESAFGLVFLAQPKGEGNVILPRTAFPPGLIAHLKETLNGR